MSHLFHGLLINLIRRSDCQTVQPVGPSPADDTADDLEVAWFRWAEAEEKKRCAHANESAVCCYFVLTAPGLHSFASCGTRNMQSCSASLSACPRSSYEFHCQHPRHSGKPERRVSGRATAPHILQSPNSSQPSNRFSHPRRLVRLA